MAAVTNDNYSQQGDLSAESEKVGETVKGDGHMSKPKHNPENEIVNITPSMFYDILMKKRKVLMRPMLLMTGGLPKSGKSQAIKELLQLESDESSSQQGFTCYNMISIARSGTTAKIGNSQLFHDFGFLAGLKTSLPGELSSFTEDGPQSLLDDDDIHHRHRMGLKATWEKLKGDISSDESRLFHSRNLAEGPALVKIWDTGFDSFSSQFLRCFSGHFYNSYTWLFTDLERDLNKLYLPPSKDDTQLMSRRSRIQYLLNPSKLSSKLNFTRHAVCTIFAMSSKPESHDDELQKKARKLKKLCKIAAPQIGCSELISKQVIPLPSDGFAKLTSKLQKIATNSKASQDIPLSHLFLRGSLELESSVFMRREELKRKARLCGIDDRNFDEFCKSFTSFGSIIDVGLVSTSDIIIVKPDEFLTTLDQAFSFNRIKDYRVHVARNGILTSDAAFSLYDKDHQLFLEVLEAVGLATSISESQCIPSQGGRSFYIPSLRLHEEEMNFNPKRVQLVTSMRYPSISLIVALTKHLLQAIPSSQLMLSMDRNKTRIISPESEVEIVFHGEVIEFAVFNEKEKSFIKEIIQACNKLPFDLKNRYGEAKFYFAVLCEKHDNYIGFNFYRKRHILPIASDEFDCDKCTFTENMENWSSAINEVRLDERFKLDGNLVTDDITRLSKEISKYEHVHVLAFIKALGQDRQLPDDQSKWNDVLMAAIAEWNVQSRRESKKKMAVILIELHMEFKQFHSEAKPKFKQLARGLDLQTLTMDQIKSLSKYCHDQLNIKQDNIQADQKKEKSETLSLKSQIQEEGKINISVVKGMLYGPPRVGKTSLMKRLIGEEPLEISPSTGFDAPITVPIYKDAQVTQVAIQEGKKSNTSENEWQHLNLKQTLQFCLNFCQPTQNESPKRNKDSSKELKERSSQRDDDMTIDDEEDYSDAESISSEESDDEEGYSDTESRSSEESDDEVSPDHDLLTITDGVTDKKNDDIKEPDNVDFHTKIAGLIKGEEWEKIREKLKGIEDMTLFQIIDVGGQPEFHDILPLLLTGPAMYLLFFNLNQELDEPYDILYQHEDELKLSNAYKSQLTVFKVLHQILSSISSMSEFSPAIIIGTHLDQLKSTDGKKFVWKPTDDPLKDRMKEHFYYKKSLILNQVDGENCIVFPVDNINGTMEDEIKQLRQKIKNKLKEFESTPLPTSWALFYYLLRNIDDDDDPKYCTLDEAKQLAEGLNIKDVETALKYFHEQFGSVLYYHDVADEDHIKYIFRDPNVILKAVNDLVAVCYGSNSKNSQIAEKLRDTGIVTQDELNLLNDSFHNKKLCSYVIELLKSRHILSSVSVERTEMFFIPCLLRSSDDTKYIPPLLPQNEEVAPLLLKLLYKDKTSKESLNFIPPGLFTSTIVKLSEIWELSRRRCYKNKVSFQIDSLSAVTLIAQDEWIEVRMKRKPSPGSPTCREIRKAIKKAINENKNDCLLARFLDSDSVKLDVGFYCQCLKDSGHLHYASKVPYKPNMVCYYCHETETTLYPLEVKHTVWFCEDQKLDQDELNNLHTGQVDHYQGMNSHDENSPDNCTSSESKERIYSKATVDVTDTEGLKAPEKVQFNIKHVNEEQVIEKPEYGVKLVIPPSSVPDHQSIDITIQPVPTDTFTLPPDVQPVSCFYEFGTSGSFTKPIQLHIQHNVHLSSAEDTSRLAFVIGNGPPPYQFELCEDDQQMFALGDNAGVISVSHFCIYGIVCKAVKNMIFPPKFYAICPFYKQMDTTCWQVKVFITPNLSTFHDMLKKSNGLLNDWLEIDPESFEFESNTIALREANQTFDITELKPLEVEKDQVDKCQPNAIAFPHMHIQANQKIGQSLAHLKLNFEGTVNESFITITKEQLKNLPSTNQTAATDGTQLMTQQLLMEEPKLSDLTRLLDPVKDKWRKIGVQLDIPNNELESIGKDISLDNSDKLTQVCQLWKDKKTTEVSWRKILGVIRNPPIQKEIVCEQLEKFLGLLDYKTNI